MYQIPAHFVNASVKGAVKQGFSAENLLAAAGIDVTTLKASDSYVSHQQLATLIKTIWKWTQDEFMGLGQRSCQLGYFRLLTSNQIRFRTLKSALHYAEDHYRVTRDDAVLHLERVTETENSVRFVHHISTQNNDKDHLLNEYYLLAWHRYMSWLIKRPIPIKFTEFGYAKPAHSALYNDIFSGKFLYGCMYCALVFSDAILNSPIARSAEEVRRYVNSLPLPVFLPPDATRPISTRVKNLMAQATPHALPDLYSMAQMLELNPRTLHRKLLAEGTRFQQIKDRYRYELAIDCLVERQMSVSHISDYLGFSEAAAFCHFFKKVAGIAPSKYMSLN